MALGSGDTWDETTPTNATIATQIDDYNRELRIGVRSRMALEHEWPSSQAATAEAGMHKFITFQDQAVKPPLSGTQVGGFYTKSTGAANAVFFEDSAGNEIQITTGTAVKGGHPIVAITSTNFASVTTGTVAMPGDDTIPQTGEGVQIMALKYTPTDTAHFVKIGFNGLLSYLGASASPLTVAFFQGTTANALAAFMRGAADHYGMQALSYDFVATIATTAEVTYYVRAGVSNGGQMVMNGITGARTLGGVQVSSLILEQFTTG